MGSRLIGVVKNAKRVLRFAKVLVHGAHVEGEASAQPEILPDALIRGEVIEVDEPIVVIGFIIGNGFGLAHDFNRGFFDIDGLPEQHTLMLATRCVIENQLLAQGIGNHPCLGPIGRGWHAPRQFRRRACAAPRRAAHSFGRVVLAGAAASTTVVRPD